VYFFGGVDSFNVSLPVLDTAEPLLMTNYMDVKQALQPPITLANFSAVYGSTDPQSNLTMFGGMFSILFLRFQEFRLIR
jgi:hypothetical protein